jgi:cation:H+ antiporter
MMLTLGLCLAGLLALVIGAELLTRGGVALSEQLRVPPLVVGLTVVAVGTSAPELAVGVDAALQGNGALAVGNIAGTNTVNILLILGLSALIRPLALRLQTTRLDLPVMIAAALALLIMAMDGRLSRFEGGLLIVAGVVYTVVIVRLARRDSRIVRQELAEIGRFSEADPGEGRSTFRNLALLGVGMAIIILGADWLVDGAVGLARLWGVSDAFIGLTVVAIGTSSPELVTTIVSTLKNQRDIAIGNLLGSSIYNILLILGLTCLVPAEGVPVPGELIAVDIPVMAAVAIACAPVFLTGRRITRVEGAAFVCAYGVYLAYLVVSRT